MTILIEDIDTLIEEIKTNNPEGYHMPHATVTMLYGARATLKHASAMLDGAHADLALAAGRV